MKTKTSSFKTALVTLCAAVMPLTAHRAFAAVDSIGELVPFACGSITNTSGSSFGHGINELHEESLSLTRLAVGSASGGAFCDPKAFISMDGVTPSALLGIALPSFDAYCAYAVQNGRIVGVRQIGLCAGSFHAFRAPTVLQALSICERWAATIALLTG